MPAGGVNLRFSRRATFRTQINDFGEKMPFLMSAHSIKNESGVRRTIAVSLSKSKNTNATLIGIQQQPLETCPLTR